MPDLQGKGADGQGMRGVAAGQPPTSARRSHEIPQLADGDRRMPVIRFSLYVKFAVCVGTLALCATAHAQCADWRVRGSGLRLNGIVYDSTLWDPDGAGPQSPMLVVAGYFSRAGGPDGIAARNIAAWDGVHWKCVTP